MYLCRSLSIGCAAWDEAVFPNLISYIEAGDICPVMAKTFALEAIAEAQREFLERRHVGQLRPHSIGGLTIQPPRPIDLIRERGA